ncbi:MAG: serine hydrolase [Segetibacter sp.]|nr:serine hydrolase [Segetibacter sp.]
MRHFLVLLLASLVIAESLYAQKVDKKLQKRIQHTLQGFNGQIGIYVHDLKKNRIVSINADTVFTTASMVKVPILIGVMDKINKGELAYDQPLIYKDSLLYAGVDILGSFKNDEKIELSKVMMLMLTMSDNTASLWLQSLAGSGTRINQILDSLGFEATRVNSRTPGREANRSKYGWGQTTPKEMATLLEKISKGEMLNKPTSERMLRLLGRNYWDENGISQIPAGVFVASKTGAVDATRNEVMYVNGRKSRYVLCICTQNNKDISWKPENEAWVLTKAISKLVWNSLND